MIPARLPGTTCGFAALRIVINHLGRRPLPPSPGNGREPFRRQWFVLAAMAFPRVSCLATHHHHVATEGQYQLGQVSRALAFKTSRTLRFQELPTCCPGAGSCRNHCHALRPACLPMPTRACYARLVEGLHEGPGPVLTSITRASYLEVPFAMIELDQGSSPPCRYVTEA